MCLDAFLDNNKDNSHSKEALFRHRLCHDLRSAAAAASRGYDIQIFQPEVDREGFDLILSDGEENRRLQTKTKKVSSSTNRWRTHKGLYRPAWHLGERLGFLPDLASTGQTGGVLVMEWCVTNETDIDVWYSYSDAVVLSALKHGLVRTGAGQRLAVEKCWINLSNGCSRDRVSLSHTLFFRARSIQALLGLMGLRSSNKDWRWEFINALTKPDLPDGTNLRPSHARQAYERLSSLISNSVEAGPLVGKS